VGRAEGVAETVDEAADVEFDVADADAELGTLMETEPVLDAIVELEMGALVSDTLADAEGSEGSEMEGVTLRLAVALALVLADTFAFAGADTEMPAVPLALEDLTKGPLGSAATAKPDKNPKA
jgi:hypothetical protein